MYNFYASCNFTIPANMHSIASYTYIKHNINNSMHQITHNFEFQLKKKKKYMENTKVSLPFK